MIYDKFYHKLKARNQKRNLGETMSNHVALWTRRSGPAHQLLRQAVETEMPDLVIESAYDGRETLDILSRKPSGYPINIIELAATRIELAALATGIKQINPAIEIIVLGEPTPGWGKLNLPKYYRPIFLPESCGPDVLISCIAKLREMIEARENFEQLGQGLAENISALRSNTEIILSLLDRQEGMGVIALRRDGFFSSYNAEAQRLTGYGVEEVAHIQVWAQTLIPDYDEVRTLLGALESFWAKKSGRHNMRLRIRHRNGRIVTLSMNAVVLLDSLRQARQIVMLFFDPLEGAAVREYQVLTESGSCGFYTYLPGTGFLRMSRAALDIVNRAFSLNLSLNEVAGREIAELPLPPNVAAIWEGALRKVAGGAAFDKKDISPLGLAGRRIMDHKTMTQLKAGPKNSFAVLACLNAREDLLSDALRSLSDKALAEKTLNSIPRPCAMLESQRDEDGHIKGFLCIWTNESASQLLGHAPVLAAPVPLSEIFKNRPMADAVLDKARDVCETGGESTLEMTFPSADQTPATWHFWLGKVGDGVALFIKDITESRKEEARLKHYHHVFSHMDESIIVTDLEGAIIDWNPASERMFGYTKEQILGKSVFLLTETEKSGYVETESKQTLSDGDVWQGEHEYVRSDGSKGVAFTVFAQLKDDEGTVYGTVGLCHDLTERKRLEEKLTAKSQELQEKNLALNTLLRYAEEERVRACERVASDLARKINSRVSRILQEKQNAPLVEAHAKLLLQEIGVTEQAGKSGGDDPSLSLTEKELEVAKLIRLGKTTQEIAFILDKSPDTIRLQRISIRKKLGLGRRNQNLIGYLKKIDLRS
jgi:PAS domain S-box-containing protein